MAQTHNAREEGSWSAGYPSKLWHLPHNVGRGWEVRAVNCAQKHTRARGQTGEAGHAVVRGGAVRTGPVLARQIPDRLRRGREPCNIHVFGVVVQVRAVAVERVEALVHSRERARDRAVVRQAEHRARAAQRARAAETHLYEAPQERLSQSGSSCTHEQHLEALRIPVCHP
jgi:hypothetical protein